MEHIGLIAFILICGLFADSLLTKQKLKELSERIKNLENKSENK